MKFHAILICVAGAVLFVAGCGTPLPKAGPQAKVVSLPAASAGIPSEISQALGTRLAEDESGFSLVSNAREALTWRLAMVEHATTSIDVKYFIWLGDPAGHLLFERILVAADRGVRVRILLDDLTLVAEDRMLSAMCRHPNVDLKLYNPIGVRGGLSSSVAFALRLKKYNRRMHNKLLLVDGQLAVMGGRNVGDDYFGLSQKYNFLDLDVMIAGAIIPEIAKGFDRYWNAALAYPASRMAADVSALEMLSIRVSAETLLAEEAEMLSSFPVDPAAWAERLRGLPERMHAGTAHLVQDAPETSEGKEVRSIDILREVADTSNREVLISSPYVIPVGGVTSGSRNAAAAGVKVRMLTGSMRSLNHTPVYAHYRRHRKPMLASGIEIYEFMSQPSPEVRADADTAPIEADFISLHMKAIVIDRKQCYIGSLNLDPRAVDINTENGLLITSTPLAEEVAQLIERAMLPENAWKLEYRGKRRSVKWHSALGSHTRERARSVWQRIGVFFYGLLPIEKQL
jgi:putative cardiolipin synthase